MKIKQLTVLLCAFLMFFTFTTHAKAKAKGHYYATFPTWVRGNWYEYIPGDGYTKIIFTSTKVIQIDSREIWKDYITDHSAQNTFNGKKQVYVIGRKFSAQVSPTSHHGRATVVPGYWRVKRIYIHHKYRTALVTSVGAIWGASDSYAFRSKVHFQTN